MLYSLKYKKKKKCTCLFEKTKETKLQFRFTPVKVCVACHSKWEHKDEGVRISSFKEEPIETLKWEKEKGKK